MNPPTPRLEALLAEARWLERLARALVSDREEARELVQEVWTAAAARAPERVERPRAWLATVLRNAWRLRRRGEGARADRERAAARATEACSASAHAVVARAEAQRLLVESVLALDEPLRSTVLWHHFDSESCESIARRTNVPASTVRNRLAEARARLRERLARRRDDWMSLVLLLATPPGAAGGTGLAGPATGGLLVSTSAKLVFATVVALALGAWWSLDALTTVRCESPAGTVPALVTTTPSAPLTEDPLTAEGGRTPVAPAAEPAREAGSPAPPRTASGAILVRVLEDGRPFAGGGVARVGPRSTEAFVPEHATALTADGTARFEGLETRRGTWIPSYVVEVELPDATRAQCTDVHLAERAERECVVQLGTARVLGTVWDEAGNPSEGSSITLAPREGAGVGRVAVTDARGRYELARVPSGPVRVHCSTDARGAATRELLAHDADLELHAGERCQIDFGAPAAQPAWVGRVRTRGGTAPWERAWIGLIPNPSKATHDFVRCSAEGEFELHAPPGTYRAVVRNNVDWDHVHEFPDIVIGTEGLALDLVLPGTRISGRVFGPQGAELGVGSARLSVHARLEAEEYPCAFHPCHATADGTFAIDGLEPGTYLLSTYPLALASASAALRVTIEESDVEVRTDVRVEAR